MHPNKVTYGRPAATGLISLIFYSVGAASLHAMPLSNLQRSQTYLAFIILLLCVTSIFTAVTAVIAWKRLRDKAAGFT